MWYGSSIRPAAGKKRGNLPPRGKYGTEKTSAQGKVSRKSPANDGGGACKKQPMASRKQKNRRGTVSPPVGVLRMYDVDTAILFFRRAGFAAHFAGSGALAALHGAAGFRAALLAGGGLCLRGGRIK